MRLSKFTPSLCAGEGGVFGGMYFYHSMFQCHSQRAVWLKLLVPATLTCCSGNSPSNGAASPLAQKHCAGRGRGGWGGLGGRSGPRVGGLLCALAWLPCARCSVCLLGLLLCACFRLSLPLLGFFTLLQLAPCLVRVCAGRGQLLCPWAGGIRLSLLVGGLGPVLSIPKLCFNPFRKNDAQDAAGLVQNTCAGQEKKG